MKRSISRPDTSLLRSIMARSGLLFCWLQPTLANAIMQMNKRFIDLVSSLRQSERNNAIAGLPVVISTAGSNDRNILFTVLALIRDRRRIRTRFHFHVPQDLSGFRFERAEMAIVRRRNKHQPACRSERASHVHCSRVLHTLRFQFLNNTKRHAPRVLASIGVDRHHLTPRWFLTRPVVFGVPEARETIANPWSHVGSRRLN